MKKGIRLAVKYCLLEIVQIVIFLAVAFYVMASVCCGQEITGGESVIGVNQYTWLALELPEGMTGKFDNGIKNCTLDTDPSHVAPNAAMFYATMPGEFRVVAAVVDSSQAISFLEKIITVEDGGVPPSTGEAITKENVKKWLNEVPLLTRKEKFVQPITGQQMTRQEAVAQTFTNIGNAGSSIASVPGLDLMLSTALVSALGETAGNWKPFAESVDNGLSLLKKNNVKATDYAKAFLLIGEVLSNE